MKMSPVSFDPNSVTDEEYLVLKAKSVLSHDPCAAKAWMITAKTLFPSNFGVQFEAYQIEKSARSVKEAAKCFGDIFKNFQEERELWQEIQALTTALRSENGDSNYSFLREMFSHIPQDVQRDLLLVSADRSEDTMEHCRLLLLLLRQFPRSVVEHGPPLVDTLMTAEKHSHYQNADLPDVESKIDDPWKNLFAIQEMTAKKLGWELSSLSSGTWSKDSYWQKLLQFRQTIVQTDDPTYMKHMILLYYTTTFFLFCLHEYVVSLETGVGDMPLLLVEAFCSRQDQEDSIGEPKAKRRKLDGDESSTPLITVAKPPVGQSVPPVVHNYIMAVRCWDLLHSTEYLEREFTKLSQHLRLNNTWLQGFLIDTAIYKGKFQEAIEKILFQETTASTDCLQKNLRLASTYHSLGQHSACMEHVLQIVSALPVPVTSLQLSLSLQQPSRSGRHLHYLPMHRTQILQYCVKLLVSALKQSLSKPNVDADLIMGHIFTLLQFDWPLEEDLAIQLLERIHQHGSFSYSLFQTYIINVDLLEEFMYLSTEQGGSVGLDVVPTTQTVSQRRISTRGVDKGVKEDFKQAMKRQAARSEEPLDSLIIKFLGNERELLLHSLL
ncbi:Integrator complex subunit 10 [Gryllus bimaculatus]|nr:Integrator complex subunit 10 [Gryllus bimaculatus]